MRSVLKLIVLMLVTALLAGCGASSVGNSSNTPSNTVNDVLSAVADTYWDKDGAAFSSQFAPTSNIVATVVSRDGQSITIPAYGLSQVDVRTWFETIWTSQAIIHGTAWSGDTNTTISGDTAIVIGKFIVDFTQGARRIVSYEMVLTLKVIGDKWKITIWNQTERF